jgi:hypothetical protein
VKKLLSFVSFIFIFGGCTPQPNVTQTTPKDEPKASIEKSEEFERTISYQDIITKINDINTKKKENQRIKEIVKEYQYNVSDDDSKNSAREKALNQVKVIILEEIGVFVESYLELNKIVTDEKYHKQFKQEIKNLTAGIIKTKILDEKYNGKQYYVKASVLVDPDSVSEGISEILKIKANQSEIKKLNALLESKENEIDMRSQETIALQKKITNQEFLNMAKEEELKTIQVQLQHAQRKLQKYEIEEQRLQGELGQIQQKVNQAMQRIENNSKKACYIRPGMTRTEVKQILGEPDGGLSHTGNLIYGRVTINFPYMGQIVSSISGCY